ncbi:Acetylornithine deacetylase [Limihaloglobus sulfuriphilus]|uniref:Acetylornithine deacetylase n=1 Tax=Limihaloglobus sulfuriphilus TaxID=1851148 RepID=A0A1Q2MG17_9BACT|nr:M20/M25/M40 family metallo-hydrolase [Limihaloglobus sulfuriphilus]AQQ71645.1 Acetylornithine deacetylase [Limihaloglobus sulfuriphilus]
MPGRINTERLRELFRDMVNIYSPTGKEGQITEYLARYLYENDLPVTMREVTEGRRNIEVVFGPGSPELAFIGHIDTVPAFDIENYEYQEENGEVFGLGTADMKGGCAAMIEAFVSHIENGGKIENTALFLVVGEEDNGDGTAAMLEAMSFPWAIVAEPTNLVPCFDHFGYIEMLVQAYGRRRHASMAGRDQNAVFSLLRTLLRLAETIETEFPETVMNIRSVHSSESGFAVPGSSEAWLDMHIKPEQDSREFVSTLKKLADECLCGGAVTSHEITFPTIAGGYSLEQSGRLWEILKKAYSNQGIGWKPGTFKSHSDANLLRDAGCKPVILGPGRLARAHTRDEAVSFDEVAASAGLYRQMLSIMQP